jgi:hypothetical protein
MRITSYLDRYRNGEQTEVWAELVALGPTVRQEPLYSEAVVVAQEMMARARHNVALLVERLHILNYHFAHPHHIWDLPTSAFLADLHQFDQQYGLLPLTLRAWFEVVGEIDFTGAHPTLSYYAGMSSASAVAPSSDPLSIGSAASYWLQLIQSSGEHVLGEPPYEFIIAPDADHKANTSGGGPTAVQVPDPRFDAPLTEGWEGMYFVPYLRLCFQWGGFPGLADDDEATEAAQRDMAFLTKDLLPI